MLAALDHDALFKLVLTAFFREFIDLVAPDLAAALDPAPPVFLDKERFADLFDPDRREADLVAQVRLVPVRRANMRPHAWFMDDIELRAYRHTIETVNSQLEKMGAGRLTAGANAGFELKVHATLIALICTNMN